MFKRLTRRLINRQYNEVRNNQLSSNQLSSNQVRNLYTTRYIGSRYVSNKYKINTNINRGLMINKQQTYKQNINITQLISACSRLLMILAYFYISYIVILLTLKPMSIAQEILG